MITRIHVNRHKLRDGKACLGVERSGRRKSYHRQVIIHGPAAVIFRPEKPLKCGAKAWIETTAKVSGRRR